jgi:hypothetical protein
MKMSEGNLKVERGGGTTNETRFTMEASGKAFEAIASSLYKNGIRAIVRELGTNAADAHVMLQDEEVANGNKKSKAGSRPFDVFAPTDTCPEFVIRDYGIGLTPEKIRDTYTVVFRSDKNHTNDLTGGFGMGSKTPFAYTDNFAVTSWTGGMKRVYSVYKDETGVPTMPLMSEAPSDEPRGVEIRIGVNRIDFGRFHAEIASVYKWFRVRPNVHCLPGGYSLETSEVVLSGDRWALTQSRGTLVVQMGDVGYPVNVSDLSHDFVKNLHPLSQEMLRLGPIIYCDVGDVDITISRESLKFTDKTYKVIRERLADVVKGCRDEAAKQIAACETLTEARTMLLHLKQNAHMFKVMDKEGVKWNGRQVSLIIELRGLRDKTKEEIEEALERERDLAQAIKNDNEDKEDEGEDGVEITMDGDDSDDGDDDKDDEEKIDHETPVIFATDPKKKTYYRARCQKVAFVTTKVKRGVWEKKPERVSAERITYTTHMYIFVDDLGPGAYKKLTYWADCNNIDSSTQVFVFNPGNPDYPLAKFLEEEDLIKIARNISELPNPPPSMKPPKRKTPQILQLNNNGYRRSRHNWEVITVEDDGEEHYLYVRVSAFDIVGGAGFAAGDSGNLIEWLKETKPILGLDPNDIYGVRKQWRHRISKRDNWVVLDEHVRRFVAKRPDWQEKVGKMFLWNKLSDDINTQSLCKAVGEDSRLRENSPIRRLQAIITDLKGCADDKKVHAFSTLRKMADFKIPEFPAVAEEAKKLDNLIKAKYPLAHMLDTRYLDKEARTAVVHYINIMDKTRVPHPEGKKRGKQAAAVA